MPTVNDLTTPAEDEDTVKTEARPVKGASTLAGVTFDLGITAMFTWVAGIALHRGFGVSVPFTAVWLMSLIGYYFAQLVTGQLASVWHKERVKADVSFLAASLAAQDFIEEQRNAKAFLDMDKKIKDMSAKVDGGYL